MRWRMLTKHMLREAESSISRLRTAREREYELVVHEHSALKVGTGGRLE